LVANIANNCSGVSSNGIFGLYAEYTANDCYSWGSVAYSMYTYIAIGCYGGGTNGAAGVDSDYSYNMP
jgi:hypothetical protein